MRKKTIQTTNIRAGYEKFDRFQTGYWDFNQLGHTASYHTIKELETELTFQATESGNCTPTGMSLHLEQVTGVAFVNLTGFVETVTGKDIQELHPYWSISIDTSSADFEISVKCKRSDQENITLEVEPSPKEGKLDNTHISETEVDGGYNRISISFLWEKNVEHKTSELEIEPYSKKPKIAALSISSSKEIQSLKHPESLTNARYLDLLWMVDLCHQ